MVGPRRIILAAIALPGLAMLAACGGGRPAGPTATPALPNSGALTIRAAEWRFEPASIVLHQGEQVRIEFHNDGEILHDLKIEDLSAESVQSQSSGPLSAGEGELFVGADAGEGGTLVFTPKEWGAFAFLCTVPRHRQLGMRGTIVVEEP